MMKTLMGVAFGAGAMMAAGCAGATVLVATYTDASSTETWKQDSNPTPTTFTAGAGTTIAVWDAAWTLDPGPAVTYANASYGGGFSGSFGAAFGSQIYTGSEAAPVFAVGRYAGLSDGSGGSSGVLTLSAAAVPEPATWAMMLAGFAGLGALSFGARRRPLAA